MADNSVENDRELLKIKKEILNEEKENLESNSSSTDERLKLKDDDVSCKNKIKTKPLETAGESKENLKDETNMPYSRFSERNSDQRYNHNDPRYFHMNRPRVTETSFPKQRNYDQFKFNTYKKYPNRFEDPRQVGCLLFHKKPSNSEVECEKSILLSKREIQRHYAIEAMMIAEERRSRLKQAQLVPAVEERNLENQQPVDEKNSSVTNGDANNSEAKTNESTGDVLTDKINDPSLEMRLTKLNLQDRDRIDHYKKAKSMRIQQYVQKVEQEKQIRNPYAYQPVQPFGYMNYTTNMWHNNRFRSVYAENYPPAYQLSYTHLPYRAPCSNEWNYVNHPCLNMSTGRPIIKTKNSLDSFSYVRQHPVEYPVKAPEVAYNIPNGENVAPTQGKPDNSKIIRYDSDFLKSINPRQYYPVRAQRY